jgi:putative glutamine amidotransferase
MPPTIGVVPCRSLADYLESVRRAGGAPRVLDVTKDLPAEVVTSVHGILLTGGGDVDPARYGLARHSSVAGIDVTRDEFEIELVRRAYAANLPMFGICRGLQVLSVALGGTLVQDISTEMPGSLPHSVTTPLCAIAHEAWINKGNLLGTLMQDKLAETDGCSVNSRHHQAVKRLAPGFDVTATAPDGVVEAIEDPKAAFCLAVQWHPENFWRTGEFRMLFDGFIEASSRARP